MISALDAGQGLNFSSSYLRKGLAANRPVSVSAADNMFKAYYATDTQVLSLWNGTSWDEFTQTGGSGLTSVGIQTNGNVFNNSGTNNPLTSNGTISLPMFDQADNKVLASPADGSTGQPIFRALSLDDLKANIADVTGIQDGDLLKYDAGEGKFFPYQNTLIPALATAQNTTSPVVIFNLTIPANTWLDGEMITCEYFALRSSCDTNDGTFGEYVYSFAIDNNVFESNTDTSNAATSPAFAYDLWAFRMWRIGNDLWFLNCDPLSSNLTVPNGIASNTNPTYGAWGDGSYNNDTLIEFNKDFTQDIHVTLTAQFTNAFPGNIIEPLGARASKF